MGYVRSDQMCSRCRNHNIKSILKGHKKNCIYRNCKCGRCEETKSRQKFIASEIAYHRKKSKSGSGSESSKSVELVSSSYSYSNSFNSKQHQSKSEIRRNQMCARCKNHGIDVALKGHKNDCPFASCLCNTCSITSARRKIMAKQIRDYRHTSKDIENIVECYEIEDDDPPLPILTEIKELEKPVKSPTNIVPLIPQFDDDFYMVQSLYEQFILSEPQKKFQLLYAFVKQSCKNWTLLENSLQRGKKFLLTYFFKCQPFF